MDERIGPIMTVPHRPKATQRTRLADTLRRFGRDRSGLAAIEYGLIMGTIVAAAAVALPALQDQLQQTAERTETDFLNSGLPTIPTSVTSLAGTPTDTSGEDSAPQRTGFDPDDLNYGVDPNTPQGSRRYYADDGTFEYGEQASDTGDGGTGDGGTGDGGTGDGGTGDGGTGDGGTGSGDSDPNTIDPFVEDFAGVIDTSAEDAIDIAGLDTVNSATLVEFNDGDNAIEPPLTTSATTFGTVTFEEVDLTTLLQPQVTLAVQVDPSSGSMESSGTAIDFLEVQVSYNNGADFETLARYDGSGQTLVFNSGSSTAFFGPTITTTSTDLAFNLDPTKDSAIIQLATRVSGSSENFFIQSVGVEDGVSGSGAAVIASEDFSTASSTNDSDLIASTDYTFDPTNDEARSASDTAGFLTTRTVDVRAFDDITIDIDFAARYDSSLGTNSFESADDFSVTIQTDGSTFVTETFTYDSTNDRFVGNGGFGHVVNVTSGGSLDFTSLSYSVPDDTSNVQVTINSSGSEPAEIYEVGSIAVNGTVGSTSSIQSEDFVGVNSDADSPLIASTTNMDFNNGYVRAPGNSSSNLTTVAVDVSSQTGTQVNLALAARTFNGDDFDTGGDYFDVVISDGSTQLVNERYNYNSSNQTFVGATSGNVVNATAGGTSFDTVSYAIPDSAGSVTVSISTTTSSTNEKFDIGGIDITAASS